MHISETICRLQIKLHELEKVNDQEKFRYRCILQDHLDKMNPQGDVNENYKWLTETCGITSRQHFFWHILEADSVLDWYDYLGVLRSLHYYAEAITQGKTPSVRVVEVKRPRTKTVKAIDDNLEEFIECLVFGKELPEVNGTDLNKLCQIAKRRFANYQSFKFQLSLYDNHSLEANKHELLKLKRKINAIANRGNTKNYGRS